MFSLRWSQFFNLTSFSFVAICRSTQQSNWSNWTLNILCLLKLYQRHHNISVVVWTLFLTRADTCITKTICSQPQIMKHCNSSVSYSGLWGYIIHKRDVHNSSVPSFPWQLSTFGITLACRLSRRHFIRANCAMGLGPYILPHPAQGF